MDHALPPARRAKDTLQGAHVARAEFYTPHRLRNFLEAKYGISNGSNRERLLVYVPC
jgi:hypothetical protein